MAIADRAETISEIAVLAGQTALFGLVASDSTCRRLLDALDEPALARVAAARLAPGRSRGRSRGHFQG